MFTVCGSNQYIYLCLSYLSKILYRIVSWGLVNQLVYNILNLVSGLAPDKLWVSGFFLRAILGRLRAVIMSPHESINMPLSFATSSPDWFLAKRQVCLRATSALRFSPSCHHVSRTQPTCLRPVCGLVPGKLRVLSPGVYALVQSCPWVGLVLTPF